MSAAGVQKSKANPAVKRSKNAAPLRGETGRGQRLLLALSQSAQAVQRAHTPDEIYRTMGAEMVELGFQAMVFTLAGDKTHLIVSYLSFDSRLLSAAEKLAGLSARDYRIPMVTDGIYQRLVATRPPTFVESSAELTTQALPARLRPLIGRLLSLLGSEQSIYAPLLAGGEVFGLLGVTGAHLTEADVPAITAFANQTAIALENVRLYQETRAWAAEMVTRVAEQTAQITFQASLVASASDAIIGTDMQYSILSWNPAAETQYGWKAAEVIGHPLRDFIQNGYLATTREAVIKEVTEKGFWKGEVTQNRRDGSRFPSLSTVSLIKDQQGKSIGFVAVNRDITERKRAEESLELSEDRYRDIVENSQDLVCTHDLQGRILSANLAASKAIGYPLDVMIGRNIRDILAPERKKAFAAYLREIKKKGAARGLLQVLTGSGEKRVWEYNNTLRTEGVDEPVVRGMARDVTERFMAEKALRKSEAQLAGVINTTLNAIITVDEEQRISAFNPAAEQIFRCPAAEALGQPLERFIPEEGRKEHADFVRKFGATGQSKRMMRSPGFMLTCQRADGTLFPSEISISHYTVNRQKYFTAILRDITERKEAQEKLAASESELRALFASMHDVVLVIDREGVYRKIAPTNPALLYKPPEELLGRALKDVFPAEKAEEFQKVIRKVLKTGQTDHIEYELTINDRPVWFSVFVTPLTEDSTVWVARDITERKLAEEKIKQHIQRLNALHTIDISIAGSFDIRVTLNILLQQVVAQLGVDAAVILLLKPGTQTLAYAAGHGFRGSSITRLSLRLGEDYAGRIALERRPISIPDLSTANPPFTRASLTAGEGFVSYYGIPLVAKGQVKGVLEILHRSRLEPDPDWLEFLEILGGQAAIAIDNTQLFDGLQVAHMDLAVAYDATIEGWSKALDLRDKETEGHTQRVAEMTMNLAREMGVPEKGSIHIRRGALLHDIGKMGVPDSVLLKAGPLTDEEWRIMRQHPDFACEMISPIAYLRPALDIPYCHHEKWDGTGYPRGLKGEQIPLAARIFAVVDVWDALRSDRPYRKGWPADKALQYIREQSGLHFDPQVVETFLRLLPTSP
ncbi:MAG: putative PAS/PAC sensor protein [Anaerolineaceae bacterium]|nr:MAG: putative PAS/PAC sensor protein [Anaerolineaceae bacterium]